MGWMAEKLRPLRIRVYKMKKGILNLAVMTSLLLASQIAHSQTFSDVSPSGHTLYYWVNYNSNNTVLLVNNPNSYGDTIDASAYLNYTGNLIIPMTVVHNGTTYNVNSINYACFRDCVGLTSVSIPSTVRNIGYECFKNCTGLTSVTIPSSVTDIDYGAFYGCSGLTSITIPYSVEGIYDYAFANCTGLTTIDFDADSCPMYYQNGNYTHYYYHVFSGCNNVSTINIGDNVRWISPYTFHDCKNITNLTIGKNIETFYWNALADTLNSLNTVNYNAKDMHVLGTNSVTVGLFKGRENSLANLTIGNDVEKLPDWTFKDCTSLISVVFNADSCTKAGSTTSGSGRAFEGCNNVNSFTFGNNVKIIPAQLCYGMSCLITLTIPNNITSIGGSAFYNCSGLTSVAFNADSCIFAGYSNRAFQGCNNIASFTFGNNVKVIPAYLCSHMSNLTSVTIPNSCISIGDESFGNCSGLSSVIIPDATKYVYWSFPNCTGLQSVTIGSSVESMNYAFSGCNHLTTINVRAEYPPTCNEGTFANVPAYADIIVPCGAKYRYEVTDYWKDFSRITENCDGIDNVESNDIRVWVDGGQIKVDGAAGLTVRIFDLEGRMVSNGNLPTGVYMVRVDGLPARKVVVIR